MVEIAPVGDASGAFTRSPDSRLLADCGMPWDEAPAFEISGVPGRGVPPPMPGRGPSAHAVKLMARAAKSIEVFMLSSYVAKTCRYIAMHVQDLFTCLGLVGSNT